MAARVPAIRPDPVYRRRAPQCSGHDPNAAPLCCVKLSIVMRKEMPVRTKARLQAVTDEDMAVIGREPEPVKPYFQDPYVRYAA